MKRKLKKKNAAFKKSVSVLNAASAAGLGAPSVGLKQAVAFSPHLPLW